MVLSFPVFLQSIQILVRGVDVGNVIVIDFVASMNRVAIQVF